MKVNPKETFDGLICDIRQVSKDLELMIDNLEFARSIFSNAQKNKSVAIQLRVDWKTDRIKDLRNFIDEYEKSESMESIIEIATIAMYFYINRK